MPAQSKAVRSRTTPYDRAEASPQPIAEPISSSPISPPEPVFPTTTPLKNLRDCYLQTCRRFYPNIQPRHDFDIITLGCGQFKGPDKDFYDYSDCALEMGYERFTAEKVRDGSARAHIILESNQTLNEEEIATGIKPSPGEEGVYIRPLSQSDYSLRLWGRGVEAKREYCLDFVDTATGQPVNSPFEYEL